MLAILCFVFYLFLKKGGRQGFSSSDKRSQVDGEGEQAVGGGEQGARGEQTAEEAEGDEDGKTLTVVGV